MGSGCVGVYLVQSPYLTICNIEGLTVEDDTVENLWSMKVPPKIHFFLWRVLRNKLTAPDNLLRRRVRQWNMLFSLVH